MSLLILFIYFFYLFRSPGSYWPLFREHPPSSITRCYCPLRTTKEMALVTDPTVCQRPGSQCHRPDHPSVTQWLQLPYSPSSFSLFLPFLELSQASRRHFLLSVGLLINISSFLLFFAPVPLPLPITTLTIRSDPTPHMAYPREGFEPREDTGGSHEKWKEPLQDGKRPHQ